MRPLIAFCLAALLTACSAPTFVTDAPPVPVTSRAPDHFVLPARFGLVRTVYGYPEAASDKERLLWEDLAERADALGTFSPLIQLHPTERFHQPHDNMIETARAQRYRYILRVAMEPSTGTADVVLIDVSSGAVMATARATSPKGGERGFWGGRIGNTAQRNRVTYEIAQATLPVVEDILRGAAKRQK